MLHLSMFLALIGGACATTWIEAIVHKRTAPQLMPTSSVVCVMVALALMGYVFATK